MPFAEQIYRLTGKLLIAILLVVGVSCTDDKFPVNTETSPDDNIKVGATIIANENTRGYVAEGDISEGTYYLLYRRPNTGTSSYYNNALVDFGANEGPTTGFAYYFDENENRKDLKWRSVYGEGSSSQNFYLSNINPDSYTIYSDGHWNHFRFYKRDTPYPYVTGPLDKVNGSNDMLFGTASARSTTGRIDFTLNHILSLLKVNVEVYGAKSDNHLVSLENAEVTISNLCTTVGAFQLTDPTNFRYSTSTSTTANTGYGTYFNTQTITLIEPGSTEICWESIEDGTVREEFNDYAKKIYTTKEFVMPPQTIPPTTNVGRPLLSVKVPKRDMTGSPNDMEGYVTYSGYIPDVMFNSDSYGNIINPTPETISLKSGYQLNITATINSPETDLTFAPVKIEAWVSKGTHTITTKQAGIYSADDFDNAIKAFQEGRLYDLERYGYIMEDGTYYLQFWGSVNLDKDKIQNSMKFINGEENESIEFAFAFNGYTITVTDSNGDSEELSGAVGQQTLYKLVSGKEVVEYIGINSSEQFMTLFNMCKEDSDAEISQLTQYGYFNNLDNTFVFDIKDNITLKIEDILWQIPTTAYGYNIVFSIKDGKEVKVLLPDTEVYIPCKNSDAIDRIAKMSQIRPTSAVEGASGFDNNDELLFLIECYNNYYKYYNNILQPFGAKATNSSNWTFYMGFVTDLPLKGEDIALKMIPDDEKPSYSIGTRYSNVWLTISSPWMSTVSARTGTGLVKAFLAGSSTTSSLSSTATYYYNNNFSYLWSSCGYFKDYKWYFPFATSCKTVAYSSIWNRMIPDPDSMKYDYEFSWSGDFTVTEVPVAEDSSETETLTLSGEDGAAILKSLANGTYWENK